MNAKNDARVYAMAFASVYPLYIQKAEKKGRTKAEVDEIIRWLTGHTQASLEKVIADRTTFADFFAHALAMNPPAPASPVCGVRVEEIEEQRCGRSATSKSSWTSWRRGRRWRRYCGGERRLLC